VLGKRSANARKAVHVQSLTPPTLLEMAIFASYRIGLLKCSAMEPSLLCPDCKRLEREYQLTIAEIYSVVGGRFKSVREKLHQLFRWQDVRDEAVEAFYEHKKTHVRRASGLRRVA